MSVIETEPTTTRRAQGEGALSVVREPVPAGSGQPAVEGIWRYRVVVGYKDGRPVQASKTFRGMREPTKKALSEFRRGLEDRGQAPRGEMTFETFLNEHYMKKVIGWGRGTRAHKSSHLRSRIIPSLGRIPLGALTTEDLDKAYTEWTTTPTKRSPNAMPASTLKQVHSTIHDALSKARTWGYVTNNVAGDATTLKIERRAPTTPTEDQIGELIASCKDDDPMLAAAILIGALTGMRLGEVAGLKWKDVDRAAMVLRVQRGITHMSRQEYARQGLRYPTNGNEEGPTKTRKPRLVPINTDALLALEAHRANVERQTGFTLSDECFIVTDYPNGLLPTLKPISARYRRLAHKLGIKTRFHDLRHYRATFLLGKHVPHADVAELLGNTPATVVDTYGHPVPETVRAAAELRNTFVASSGSVA
jgi:integrase